MSKMGAVAKALKGAAGKAKGAGGSAGRSLKRSGPQFLTEGMSGWERAALEAEAAAGNPAALKAVLTQIPQSGGVRGAVGGGLRSLTGLISEHPVAGTIGAAGLALPIADWAMGLGKDGLDAITGADDAYRRKVGVQELLARMHQEVVDDRRQQLVQMNTMKLMQQDPQLATQLMVGRRLPPGAAMFGVQPRRDLIEEVAEAMSNGQFADDTPGGDPLAGFLGG